MWRFSLLHTNTGVSTIYLWSCFMFKKYVLLYVYECFSCMYTCVPCTCPVPKSVSDPLELHVIVSYQWVLGTEPNSSEEWPVLLAVKPSLQPLRFLSCFSGLMWGKSGHISPGQTSTFSTASSKQPWGFGTWALWPCLSLRSSHSRRPNSPLDDSFRFHPNTPQPQPPAGKFHAWEQRLGARASFVETRGILCAEGLPRSLGYLSAFPLCSLGWLGSKWAAWFPRYFLRQLLGPT